MTDFCYVHEDDWGMIDIVPVENREAFAQAMKQAQRQAYLDSEPLEPEVSIQQRGISLDTFAALFDGVLTRANELRSGYTTDVYAVDDGFAFFDEDFGAFYGITADNIITQLFFDNRACNCDKDYTQVIAKFAAFSQKHNLILADWFVNSLVITGDESAFLYYLEEE